MDQKHTQNAHSFTIFLGGPIAAIQPRFCDALACLPAEHEEIAQAVTVAVEPPSWRQVQKGSGRLWGPWIYYGLA